AAIRQLADLPGTALAAWQMLSLRSAGVHCARTPTLRALDRGHAADCTAETSATALRLRRPDSQSGSFSGSAKIRSAAGQPPGQPTDRRSLSRRDFPAARSPALVLGIVFPGDHPSYLGVRGEKATRQRTYPHINKKDE